MNPRASPTSLDFHAVVKFAFDKVNEVASSDWGVVSIYNDLEHRIFYIRVVFHDDFHLESGSSLEKWLVGKLLGDFIWKLCDHGLLNTAHQTLQETMS